MDEEQDPRMPDHQPQQSASSYWSGPADDAGEPQPAGASVVIGTSEPLESESAISPPRAPTAAFGWVALSLAALCVIADVVAVMLAVQRSWVSATQIAEGTNVATAIVFVVGLFAAWRKRGRWLGVAAMVVAVLANPFILSHLLAFLAG